MGKINRYASDTPKAYRTVAFLFENETTSPETTETNMKFTFGSWDNPINLIEFLKEYGIDTIQNSLPISLHTNQ